MELIPLISDVLIFLIGFLVLIVIVTVVSKKFRKQPEEETPVKPIIPEKPNLLQPESKSPDIENKQTVPEKPGIPRGNFLDNAPSTALAQAKKDFLSAGNPNEPQNITIKPKDASDDLFRVKEEKSNAKRYRPKSGKNIRNSSPRFQILNDDLSKNSGNSEADSDENAKQD